MKRIGAMIRLYCRIHEISERQLAKDLGMSISTLHRFIRGKELTLSNIKPLLDWLLADEKDQPK